LALLAVVGDALGQGRSQTYGDFELHYNAIATVVLEPEIAQRYEIQRSQRRGLLTVSLQRDGEPVPAAVNARSQNLAGQTQAIRMREIIEGDAVYYIGTFGATHEEELEFKVTAQPKDQKAGPFELVFEHTFFGDQ
jgi:hypothetical protein